MKRTKIIIIAAHLGYESAQALEAVLSNSKNVDLIVSQNSIEQKVDLKNHSEIIINKAFQPDPIKLTNNYHHADDFLIKTKIKDLPRNKYIDNPRFNHKK